MDLHSVSNEAIAILNKGIIINTLMTVATLPEYAH